MANELSMTIGDNERQIMTIVRSLPPEGKSQVLAFARFLASETLWTTDLDSLEKAGIEDAYTEADARWDELLVSEEGQLALDKLADEALAEIRAGNAKPMILGRQDCFRNLREFHNTRHCRRFQ